MVFQSFLMQFTNYGNIHTIVLMLVFYFLTVLFFTFFKLRCKFLFFFYISSAELDISSAISPQQNQFSISFFRWNTYFYSPQSFFCAVLFHFLYVLFVWWLFLIINILNKILSNLILFCVKIFALILYFRQILFDFLNRYLCRSSALRHVKSFCQLSYFLHPATPSMNFSFQRLLQRMVFPPHSICTKGKEYLFDLWYIFVQIRNISSRPFSPWILFSASSSNLCK